MFSQWHHIPNTETLIDLDHNCISRHWAVVITYYMVNDPYFNRGTEINTEWLDGTVNVADCVVIASQKKTSLSYYEQTPDDQTNLFSLKMKVSTRRYGCCVNGWTLTAGWSLPRVFSRIERASLSRWAASLYLFWSLCEWEGETTQCDKTECCFILKNL